MRTYTPVLGHMQRGIAASWECDGVRENGRCPPRAGASVVLGPASGSSSSVQGIVGLGRLRWAPLFVNVLRMLDRVGHVDERVLQIEALAQVLAKAPHAERLGGVVAGGGG